jgi:hypothetical protein
MTAPKRNELDRLGQAVMQLRYRTLQERPGFVDPLVVWSFSYITDLRPRDERMDGGEEGRDD